MESPHIHRYARRVGFGFRPEETVPADVLDWALGQTRQVPPIALLDEHGQPRTDLPPWIRLLETTDDVMRAFQRANDVEDELFAQGRTLPAAEYQRLRQERLAIPYWRVEHWKEVQARACAAVLGPAPVFERLWHFWTNLFMVAPGNQRNDVLVGPYQRSLRPLLTGRFRDLLWHAVTHPAMLVYLDNNRNTGPDSRARREKWTQDSTNENLGRELLELFTVSPEAGYTQRDVEETTLILTGWTVQRPDRWHKPGVPLGTRFDFDRHQPGTRSVMGRSYQAWFKPSAKLEELVDDLARHPATARHLARKLCVYFIDDDPPAAAVAAVEEAFTASGGDLPRVHEALLRAAWATLPDTRKLASPEAWFYQLHRQSGHALPPHPPTQDAPPGRRTMYVLGDLGQAIPRCPQPNGWPIRSADWLSKEMLDRRVRWAQLMAPEVIRGTPEAGRWVAREMSRLLPASSRSRGLAEAAAASGDPSRAVCLIWLSPEFLWV